MSLTQYYKWFKHFKEGRTCQWRLQVWKTFHINRRLPCRESLWGDSWKSSFDSPKGWWGGGHHRHEILTRKIQMHRVSAKFHPCLLTDGQKENRVRTCLLTQMLMKTFWRTDLAPADFFEFLTLKTILKEHRFQDIEEIKENAMRQRRAIKQNAFHKAFQKWKKHWQCAVASGENYFEGDSVQKWYVT